MVVQSQLLCPLFTILWFMRWDDLHVSRHSRTSKSTFQPEHVDPASDPSEDDCEWCCSSSPAFFATDIAVIYCSPLQQYNFQPDSKVNVTHDLSDVLLYHNAGDAAGWRCLHSGKHFIGNKIWFSCYLSYIDELQGSLPPINVGPEDRLVHFYTSLYYKQNYPR